MNKDLLYLENILESINLIDKYLHKENFARFASSSLLQDAISKRIEEIGENIKKISSSLKKKYPSIVWKDYVESRNFLTHVYQMASVRVLWNIVEKDLPILKAKIEEMVKEVKR